MSILNKLKKWFGVPVSEHKSTPIAKTESELKRTVQKRTIEWASIPAGTFAMGSPFAGEVDREPNEILHQVTSASLTL